MEVILPLMANSIHLSSVVLKTVEQPAIVNVKMQPAKVIALNNL
jgi:hypothetical protein